MIKFINENSEALYYKLLDKFGKEVVASGKGRKRPRFSIDSEFGVNKTLFALAEYTERKELSSKGRDIREKLKNKIRKLDLELSDISKFHCNSSYMRIINEAKNNYISEKIKEERKPEDGIKRQIEKLIKESGYLLAKKVLTEELDKLNEIIEEQKSNLREAEEKKERCLILLYGTAEKKEG
jgi:hypothetical protein